jgi:hypothetical protein
MILWEGETLDISTEEFSVRTLCTPVNSRLRNNFCRIEILALGSHVVPSISEIRMDLMAPGCNQVKTLNSMRVLP